jgi:hypothetical protein
MEIHAIQRLRAEMMQGYTAFSIPILTGLYLIGFAMLMPNLFLELIMHSLIIENHPTT